ncbi:hypothetical protein C4546_04350 [Candidatus Parcubacteria bacterium]|jgi:sugar lactone lactonase YvrE|nr:MAG: hypothetical protein C4546_04350 [Candidatus Parcubacteria bacterium]
MKLYLKLLISALVLSAGALVLPKMSLAAYGDTTTFLGKIYAGDGLGRTQALLDFPEDLEITADGTFFIADTYNNVIRKVSPDGTVSTYAGNGGYGNRDGVARGANFALPRGLARDTNGNLYVADSANNRIRVVKTNGTVSTLVRTGLKNPQGVLVNGSTLFIADTDNNAIRKISITGGRLLTVSTQVKAPKKLALSADGLELYVADSGSHRVLSVNIATGQASVIAGSGISGYWEGVGEEAIFQNVWGITRDGNTLYVSDGNGLTDYVRAIDLTTKQTSLFATDFRMQDLNFPCGLRVYGNNVYVANSGIGTIHRYSKSLPTDEEGFIGSTRFGNVDDIKGGVLLGRPAAFAMTTDGSIMYAAVNNQIKKIILATGETTTVIGDMVDDYGEGPANQETTRVRFSTISSIVLSSDDATLYLVDRWNNRVRKVTLAGTPTSSLITGAGLINSTGAMNNGYQEGTKCETQDLSVAGCAYFRGPQGIEISPDGQILYIADTGNNRIRSVRISDGLTTLIAGSGAAGSTNGVGDLASFNQPRRLAISEDGLTLYVAEQGSHRIRVIDLATQTVTTLVGNRVGYAEGKGVNAALSVPVGLAMGQNNLLYISNAGSSRITVVNTQTGIMTLVSGAGETGYRNGTRFQAKFNGLASLAVSRDGNTLYVADSTNDLIRTVDLVGGPKFGQPGPVYSRFLVARLKQVSSATQKAYLDIFGKNFRNGTQVTIGPYRLKTFVKSSTNINMLIPYGKMQPGLYDVKIVNRDTQQVIKKGAFAITDSKGNIPRKFFRISE